MNTAHKSAMENRRSARYQVEASAILRVQGRPGPFMVSILDVSSSGLRLSSSNGFQPGTKVTITCRGATVTGEVRYVRSLEPDFNIGILAEEASEGALTESGEMDLTRLFPNLMR